MSRGRELEGTGDVEGAARAYLEAGQPMEAARVFSTANRPLDAAVAVLEGIPLLSGELTPADASRVKFAIGLLREGGRDEHARLVTAALAGGAPIPTSALKAAMAAPPPSASRPSTARPSVSPSTASGPRSMRPQGIVEAPVVPRIDPRSEPPDARATQRPPIEIAGRPESRAGAARPALESRPGAPVERASPTAATAMATPAAPPIAPPVQARATAAPTPVPPAQPATTPTPPPAASAAVPSATPTTPVPPTGAPKKQRAAPEDGPRAGSGEDDRYRAEGGWRVADSAATERAIQQFLEGGRKGAAARVAWEAGQHARALVWFVELDLKYQAGACLRALGRPTEALAMLLELPHDDPRYRRAAFDVVALARELSRLDFEIDRFLTPFLGEGPKEVGECAAFLDLAEHFAANGFAEGARLAADGVLKLVPDDARAKGFVTQTPRRRGSERPRVPIALEGSTFELPTVEAFTALAKKHAPKPAARK